ncbi:hypothetical protein GE09DRAFT_1214685 [Coniochaeta sp. 2T2.1]|nr:hypothetical protein GE09DRAFT_1214685 [Coniochaeta sp. 2T2.1]
MASSALRAPAISQAELDSFHNTHFGLASISHFSTNFLPGNDAQHAEQALHFQQDEVSHDDAYYDEEQEDDGLGYYEDGVKRTLTDEQIAMFRHSELEARRRAQEAEDSKPAMSSATSATTKTPNSDQAAESAEPGELLSDDAIPSETTKVAVTKKKKRRRPKHRIVEEKPDLRKRTWDVVDTGLGSLDYDEQPQESSSFTRPAQRRHISYDD